MNCSDAAVFAQYAPQRITMSIQLFFCVSSIITNLLFIKECRNDLFFHRNCRVLIWMIIVINIVHSLCVGSLQGTHLVTLFTAAEPCGIIVPAKFCYSLRMPATACVVAQMAINLSIVFERAIALRHLSTYESSTSTAGFVLIVFSIASAFGITTFTFRNYDFAGRTFYCSGATSSTLLDVQRFSYFILALEAITIIMFGCVYNLNVRRSNIYDIRSKYQAKENLVVLRLLIPIVVFHFIIFGCSMVGSGLIPFVRPLFSTDSALRAYISAVYIVPVYTFGSPLLMRWILKRYRLSRSQALVRMCSKVKDENNVYFSNYAWNIR